MYCTGTNHQNTWPGRLFFYSFDSRQLAWNNLHPGVGRASYTTIYLLILSYCWNQTKQHSSCSLLCTFLNIWLQTCTKLTSDGVIHVLASGISLNPLLAEDNADTSSYRILFKSRWFHARGISLMRQTHIFIREHKCSTELRGNSLERFSPRENRLFE